MRSREKFGYPEKRGLYDPAFERDSCGVGLVAHIKGERSHQILTDAYQALLNMDHRGARAVNRTQVTGQGSLLDYPMSFWPELPVKIWARAFRPLEAGRRAGLSSPQ